MHIKPLLILNHSKTRIDFIKDRAKVTLDIGMNVDQNKSECYKVTCLFLKCYYFTN